MFCDDILAMAIDIGHGKTTIGYVGDESPRYFTETRVGEVMEQDMAIETATPQYLFGESLKYKYTGIQSKSLLVKEKCKLLFKRSHRK